MANNRTNQPLAENANGGPSQNLNLDRLIQDVNTSYETLQGYTQQGFQQPQDQSERLTQSFYCMNEVRQLFAVPEIRSFLQQWITTRGSAGDRQGQSMGASAGIDGHIGSTNPSGQTQGSS